VEVGRRYEEEDFNRIIKIEEREGYRVKLFLEMIDQREKSLVFCANQEHAAAVRDLINQNKQSTDPDYCVRVTANDGARGETFLRTFQDNDKTIPTILTTSQKLSTGVDARNIRNIVLMRPINSMIEFKQIIGRGTRLFDGKDYFTIYDFVKAYEHFSDPEWDGEPVDPEVCSKCGNNPCSCEKGETPACKVCGERPCICEKEPPEECPVCGEYPCKCKKKLKIKLADGKERTIQHMSVTTFWSTDGRQLSAAEFVKQMFGELPELFKDEDELRTIWSNPETRRALLESLAEKGYGRDQLDEIKKCIDAERSDIFDVLSYIAFALPTMTREERVTKSKSSIYNHYDYKQQMFIDFVLSQYIKEGVDELDQSKLPTLLEIKYNAVCDATDELGSIAGIRDVFVGFQKYLYCGAE
jgi:type I restriction enzyme R subunit